MCNFAIKMPSTAGPDDTLSLTFSYLNNTEAILNKGPDLASSSSINVYGGFSFAVKKKEG